MNTHKAVITAIVALSPLTLRAQDANQNQVSIQILSNGQSTTTVAPGQVSLRLDVRLSTNVGLSATQFSLDCSTPGAFVYETPCITVGTPFTEADMAIMPVAPEVNDGVSLADHPVVTFFRMQTGNYTPELFPSTILSYNIRSNGALPPSTSYSFTLTEVSDQPSYVTSSEGGTPVTGQITVGTAGAFTLQVSSNQTTALLPFCGTGTGPVFFGATLIGLWLISPRSRRR